MEYRLLGSTGLKVSILGLGTMGFDDLKRKDMYTDLIKKCFDVGINYFDTSEAYASNLSEELLGESLHQLKIPREEIVLSTKIFYGKGFGHPHSNQHVNSLGLSRKHIIESCLKTLKRLQTEYIDIVFCHRYDTESPLEETCRAMNWLIEKGKAFYWGTCQWDPEQIIQAHDICKKLNLIPPTVEHIQYNFLEREKLESSYQNLIIQNKRKVCVLGFISQNILGIARRRNSLFESSPSARNKKKIDEMENITIGIKEIANELNLTMPEFSIAWGLKNPDICSAIMGWKKSVEIDESLKALSKVSLISKEIEKKVDDLLNNCPKGEMNWKTMSLTFNNKRMI